MTEQELKEIRGRLKSATLAPPYTYSIAQMESLMPDIPRLLDEVERLNSSHCKDCCCARAWEALGVKEYTGMSIPEHIETLKRHNALLRECVKVGGCMLLSETCSCDFCEAFKAAREGGAMEGE